MKTVRQKAFAKVNLYLDVVGTSGGFHMLDSVVTTVSLYDEVIITSRKDDKIVLKTQGSIFSVSEGFDNNVYR
ncbi:MAG: 4-(cytidine 5'-diphospho)-2-C-methyl-D-erythritol kinase, partial [Clostridia bacterium]|nr:4-(cytidine 5'-diphospho)-2-C-methyl-D-erythritol kinase [Clostridia bacterium]